MLEVEKSQISETFDGLRQKRTPSIAVSLLTGGSDRPYVFGLAMALMARSVFLDLIGSDELDLPEFCNQASLNFLNLRGSQTEDAGFAEKIRRIARYYGGLIRYAATAQPRILHILWNNKFEYFDRTLLMLYYKLLGKKIVLTAHNVNAGKRDATDSFLNRLTLRAQYRLADHIFLHTAKMREELLEEFGVRPDRASVIPFGINNAVPNTSLTARQAKLRLGIGEGERTILFFGRITPYKGLEFLIPAFQKALETGANYRLIIAGRVDRCEDYWAGIRENIHDLVRDGRILLRAEFIPDHETEIYFKAADALVLPYKDIYQSGVLFLAHSFGLPVIAADVGSFRDDIEEGKSGALFQAEDPDDMARAFARYFESDLYRELDGRRPGIRQDAAERHSWDVVAHRTLSVYASLLRISRRDAVPDSDAPGVQRKVKISS